MRSSAPAPPSSSAPATPEFTSKNFLLSQKYYLHTSVHTFVTPGNYSVFFAEFGSKISDFSRKKMCLMYYNQFLFAKLLKSILLSHVYNITWFAHIEHIIFYIFCGYKKKWEKSKFGWIHNGIWKKKKNVHKSCYIAYMWDNKSLFSEFVNKIWL